MIDIWIRESNGKYIVEHNLGSDLGMEHVFWLVPRS